MIHVVGPRQLPTGTETNVRRQTGKTPIPPTRVSVANTKSSCPPAFLFGAETVFANSTIHSDDWRHPPVAFNFAADAASCHSHTKCITTMPATAPPRWSSSTASCATADRKQQKTASTCKDPCFSCLILPTCFERNCPCAKARQPCQNYNSSRGQCTNMVAAHNAGILDANHNNLPSSIVSRFCINMGLVLHPLIPLIADPAERMGDKNEAASLVSPQNLHDIRQS
jgi:hypothetical protein